MTPSPWFWLHMVLMQVTTMWIIAGCYLRRDGWWYDSRVFHELRPFFWPASIGGFVAAFGWSDSPLFGAVLLGVHLVAWLWLRNADRDNRWLRRARAFGQRVVRSVHRLRVVPAPAAGGA